MLVLGIDPGTAITGYGLIEARGNKLKVVDYACIRTPANMPLAHRLQVIHGGVSDLVRQYNPAHLAIEELFFNKNTRTALSVGHARGVIMLAAANAGLEVFEYTPLQVKQAVVGYGRADKAQIQFMVKTLLCLAEIPKPDDVADALAIAICHTHFFNSHKLLDARENK
ncbi:MAG: crossover junction endodeoxyribonuclease RuvC [Bacillota bacterium]